MSDADDERIADVLLGTVSGDDGRAFAEELATSERLRERFLDQLDVQAFLVGEVKTGVYAEFVPMPVADQSVVRFRPRAWMGAAAVAAAVIVLVATGLRLWSPGDAVEDVVMASEANTLDASAVEPGTSRPKLSGRLFVARPQRSTSDRIGGARDRVRRLRNSLHDQPTSRL